MKLEVSEHSTISEGRAEISAVLARDLIDVDVVAEKVLDILVGKEV